MRQQGGSKRNMRRVRLPRVTRLKYKSDKIAIS